MLLFSFLSVMGFELGLSIVGKDSIFMQGRNYSGKHTWDWKHFFSRFTNWKRLKIKEFLVFSIIINSITSIIKFTFGIASASIFLGMNASYYFVLCIARIIVLRQLPKDSFYNNQFEKEKFEKNAYWVIGKFIVLLGLIYFIISLQMLYSSEAIVYTGYVVYLVALVSFSKLGIAIYGVHITKNLHEPNISSLKVINFTDALVSLVVTQATLLELGSTNAGMHSTWNAYLGFSVSLIIVITGVLFSRRIIKILK